jgi:hypothetical protein
MRPRGGEPAPASRPARELNAALGLHKLRGAALGLHKLRTPQFGALLVATVATAVRLRDLVQPT